MFLSMWNLNNIQGSHGQEKSGKKYGFKGSQEKSGNFVEPLRMPGIVKKFFQSK